MRFMLDKSDRECLSPLKLFERLVKIETTVAVAAKKDSEALVLARDLLAAKLEGMNAFQKRIDRLEGTLVTEKELDRLKQLVYVGAGVLLAIEILLRFVKI